MNEFTPKTEQTSFDLKNYLLKLIAFWYLFVISIIIAFIVNYLNNRFTIASYVSNSTIILTDDFQSTQKIVGGLNLFDNRKNTENEIGVLKSFSLTKEAIENLDFEISYFKYEKFRSDVDLYKSCPFAVELDTLKPQTDYLEFHVKILSEKEYKLSNEGLGINENLKFGEYFYHPKINFKISINDKFKDNFNENIDNVYYFYKNNLNSLINSYSGRLNVDLRSPNSSILWLWINGTVPQRMVDYQNELSEVFLKRRLADKNRIVKNTISFIDYQLESVVDSLSDAEDNLQFFKQSNQILDIGKEGEMLFNELIQLQAEKKTSNLKLNFYQYLMKNIEEQKDASLIIAPSFIDIQDPVLSALIDKLQELKSKREILKYDIKKDIPNFNILELQILENEKELINHISKSINLHKYNSDEILKKISKINSDLRKIPKVEREMMKIERRFKLNDNIYTFLLERRTEAGITMATNSPGAKILDSARLENVIKKSPKPGENRNKLILISILIPILIIFLKDFLNNKIIDKIEIEKNTKIPIVASINNNISKENIPVFTHSNSPIAESFRLLKTNIQYLLIDKENPVILISSTISGEGKSFCSINLAAIIAKSNKKTLLIGLDLRKPKVQQSFNVNNNIGLSTFLIGNNTIDEIIYETHIENLYIIPSGPIPPNPAELIESERMRNLIANLKSQFDYIVIDTPPIAHVTDAMLISKYSDLNIFVIRQNYSSKNVLKIINELSEKGSLENIGILINDINQSVIFGLKYGYGFSYGYSYGYGSTDGQGYFSIPEQEEAFFKRLSRFFYDKLSKFFS
ncbi:MAG: polysaccharide biosynthesis tyrosine autokinase [Bacteroidales bacterium]|nr:polysaccharide biosynthesis tyrosine autokinase [Bacteroidales bacterium]